MLQKIFSELENLISNNTERFLHKVLNYFIARVSSSVKTDAVSVIN